MFSGYDADGVTPMLAYFQAGNSHLQFWLGDFSGGSEDYDLACGKDALADTLVNAFDVVSGSWAGGSATLTLDAEHAITTSHTLRVSGVTPSGYNGDFAVTGETSDTVTYTVADPGGTASGGIAGRLHTQITDVVQATSADIPNECHKLEGGIVIPGAFIIYCTHLFDRNAGVGDRDWQADGVSLVMFDTGNPDLPWDLSTAVITILNLPNPNNLFPGWLRGAMWALTGWFPFDSTQTRVNVDRIMLPIVDYMNDNQQPSEQKPGGQLHYVELTKSGGNWSFAKSFVMYERSEGNVHFHSACWTPNGIYLAQGDGADLNEGILFTPKGSWDDVTTAESFDVHRHWHGAGSDDPDPTDSPQHAGCAVGNNPNEIVVGNDLSTANVWMMTIPDDPDDGPGMRSMGGFHRARDLSGGTNLSLWMGTADPYNKDRCTLIRPNGANSIDLARLWYTPDNRRFAPVARSPSDVLTGAFTMPFGDSLVLSSRIGGTDTYTLLLPNMRGPTAGLAVSRGATNELRLSGGGVTNLAIGVGNTVTRITDGLHPVTGEPLDAPGFGPVYHCVTGNNSASIIEFTPADAETFSPAYAVMTAHLRIIGTECFNGIFTLEDSDSSPAEVFSEHVKICEREEWTPISQHFPADGFGGTYNPLLKIRLQSLEPRRMEFLIQLEGFYSGELPPYPMDEDTVGADENVWQNLPATMDEDTWTIVFECTIEPWAPDASVFGIEGDSFTILTIWGSNDERIDILYLAAVNGTIRANIYNGGTLQDTSNITDINIARGDKLWIGFSQGVAGTHLVASTGSREQGWESDLSLFANNLSVAPRQVRFGGRFMDDVIPLSVNIVGVNTDTQLLPDAMMEMLEDDSDDETFGAGVPTAPSLANDPSSDTAESVNAGTTSVSVTVEAGQVLVASVHSRDATPAEHTITSVVFNTSETMTQEELQLNLTGIENQVAIYTLHNPTAATANVTVNWANTPERARLHVYVIDNADIQAGSFVEARDGEVDGRASGTPLTLQLNTSPNALVLFAQTLDVGPDDSTGIVAPGADGSLLFEFDWTTAITGGSWGSSYTNVAGGITTLGSQWTDSQDYSAAIISIRGGKVPSDDETYRNRERPLRRDVTGFW